MKFKLFFVGVALFLLDLFSKLLIRTNMSPGDSFAILGKLFKITYVQNYGALAGMFQGRVSALIWLTIIALGFILYYWDSFPKGSELFLVFIIVGLFGNLVDRIFLGFVTDMFDVIYWPVFNVADSLVSVGVVGILANNIKKKKI